MKDYDVIVVGGGLAAIRSAISAAQTGASVCMAVKSVVCSGASFYPGMEMVACQSVDADETAQKAWLEEIMRTSCGLADRELNAIYIRNIADAVARFDEIGIENAKRTDPKVACFAEAMRPTYAWGDWNSIRPKVRERLEANGVDVIEHVRLIDLLTDETGVHGGLFLRGGEAFALYGRAVVLATGGFGSLYRHSLNTDDVAGDGQAAALRAGASLINLEFLQFIPGFIEPAYKTVFREMSMPYITSYRDANGKDLYEYSCLTPEVWAKCLEIRATHGPFSCERESKYFDIALMKAIHESGSNGVDVRYDPRILKDDFTFIRPYVEWLRKKRIYIEKDSIRIAPFYHASNGGVRINSRCETDIRGLYACGEVSGGIHGADRQGGMSTGSCLVFGDIAGKEAARYASEQDAIPRGSIEDRLQAYRNDSGMGDSAAIIEEVRDLMASKAAIVRNEKELRRAIDRIRVLRSEYKTGTRLFDPKTCESAVTADNSLTLAGAILSMMENRRESRGAHYREDYPRRDERYDRRFMVRMHETNYTVTPERDDILCSMTASKTSVLTSISITI